MPFLIALAIASNIGAAATLIGNPQDMMIGAVAHLNFGNYMLWSCVPVAVRAGLRLRDHLDCRGTSSAPDRPKRNRIARSCPFQSRAHDQRTGHSRRGDRIVFHPLPKEIIALAAAAFIWPARNSAPNELLGLVEWPILVFFMGLFVVTGAFQSTGYGDQPCNGWRTAALSQRAASISRLATAALSNLINNSAAVMLLLKVVNLSSRHTAYILALANSFGGSLIIVGSVSNIIVVQQARDVWRYTFPSATSRAWGSGDAGSAGRIGGLGAVDGVVALASRPCESNERVFKPLSKPHITGKRAARIAGKKLPTIPTTMAKIIPSAQSAGVTQKLKNDFAEGVETQRAEMDVRPRPVPLHKQRERAADTPPMPARIAPSRLKLARITRRRNPSTRKVPISRVRAPAALHRVHRGENRADGHRDREESAEKFDRAGRARLLRVIFRFEIRAQRHALVRLHPVRE